MKTRIMILAAMFVGALFISPVIAEDWPNGTSYLNSSSASISLDERVDAHPGLSSSFKEFIGADDIQFVGSAVKAPMPAEVNLDAGQLMTVQKLLIDQGYKAGGVDGSLDIQTESAIYSYQAEQGLAKTGYPTEETLRSLAVSDSSQEFFGLAPAFGHQDM